MTSSGGNSATVGFYLDDVPMTAPAGAQNGKVVIDPTLYDLNRIEVLRGPQGTLYGAGSMGGTVKLITNQPNLTESHASVESILSGTDGGGFNHNDNFMFNLPIINDRLALRIVGSEAYTSGWIDRIVADPFPLPTNGGATRGNVEAAPVVARYPGSNAEHLYGARVTLLWKPTDELSITPSVFFQRITQDGPSAFDSNPGTEAHYQPFNVAEPYSDKIAVYSLTGNYKFESFDITSVTAQWTRTWSNPRTVARISTTPYRGWKSTRRAPSGSICRAAPVPSRHGNRSLPPIQPGIESGLIGQRSPHLGRRSFLQPIQIDVESVHRRREPVGLRRSRHIRAGHRSRDLESHESDQDLAICRLRRGHYPITDHLKATAGLRWYAYDYHFYDHLPAGARRWAARRPR